MKLHRQLLKHESLLIIYLEDNLFVIDEKALAGQIHLKDVKKSLKSQTTILSRLRSDTPTAIEQLETIIANYTY